MGAASFCVAGQGGSLATNDAFGRRFVWRGGCSTWSTSGSFLLGRRSAWSTPGSLRVAGAALGALQAHFAWQAHHLEHLRLLLRGRRSTWSTSIEGSLATSDANGRRLVWRGSLHLEHLRLLLRCRCSTWSTSGSFCVAGAALGAFQARFAWHLQQWKHLSCVLSTHHHLHYTTSSNTPLSRQHNLTNTTSSTHHHLHNTIYTIIKTSPFKLGGEGWDA